MSVCATRGPNVPYTTGTAIATTGIVGGSGYTGALLAELLLRHPGVALTHMSSEQLAGQAVSGHLPRVRSGLGFCHAEEVCGVDVAFVCTPHGQAAPVVQRLLQSGTRVVDLSADFRLPPHVYEAWYGPHPCPSWRRACMGSPSCTARPWPAPTSWPTRAAIPRPRCWPWRRWRPWGCWTWSSTPSPA